MSQVRSLSTAPLFTMIYVPSKPNPYREPVAHVLGNGPSRKEFNPFEQIGDIFGCNLSDFDLKLKASFIMDQSCLDTIHNKSIKLPWPIIIPFALSRVAAQCPFPPTVYDTLPDGIYNGQSTGHHAVIYAMQRYRTVHLWGFDSMVVDSIESDTHSKVVAYANPNNWRRWRENWNCVWASDLAKTTEISIHRTTK